MLLFLLTTTFFVTEILAGCPLKPIPEYSLAQRTPGDGGYKISISGESNKYIPDAVYTIALRGSQTHERLQQFIRFTLSANSQHAPTNITANVGYFQLFSDGLANFNEDCINTISEAADYPKSEIQVIWKAPPKNSGCIIFTAMILENSVRWYAEDNGLSKTFCELNSVEVDKLDDVKCCACDEAKYSLILEGIWSNKTHPRDFPFSAWLTHFSDLIGASHEAGFSFWGKNHIATDGFRQLAEWGSASGVEAELRSNANRLRTLIKAAGLWYPNVNTNTTTSFKVDQKHPLLSVASMLGPSPDWVVGVSKLNLCQKDCSWIKSAIIDLYPWDAGTDNGISYMSPNSETSPREKMKAITTSYPEDPRSPFYDPSGRPMLPLARLYLNRENIIHRNCDDQILQQQVSQLEEAENTEDTSRPECQTTEYTTWSTCSVTCGKGLRMRTRSYRMPEKAVMLHCNRQLLSKEMCVAAIPECPFEVDNDNLAISFRDDSSCTTTPWDEWSECSENCGPGFKMRTRKFIDSTDRKKCPHVSLIEKEKCMESTCAPGTEEQTDPICKLSDWTYWSPCSSSCGRGVKFRTRLLMVDPSKQEMCASRYELIQQRPCSEQADCTFNMTNAKVVCMEETDSGPCRGYFERWTFDSKKFMCVPFGYGGCRGNRNNFLTSELCNENCDIVRKALTGGQVVGAGNPIDCMVTEWTPWSPCTVTCGTGRVTSHRTIKREPENGGRPCPKKLRRSSRCVQAPCE